VRSRILFVLAVGLLIGAFCFDAREIHEPFIGILYILIAGAFAFFAPVSHQAIFVAALGCTLLFTDTMRDWYKAESIQFRQLDVTKRTVELTTLCCLSGLIIYSRRMRERLADRESRLRTIVDVSPQPILLLDNVNRIVEANANLRHAVEVTGERNLLGRSILDFIPSEHQPAFMQLSAAVLQGQKQQLEFEITGAFGSRRILDLTAAPLRDATNTIIGQLCVARDVTEKRQTQRRLKEREEHLRMVVESNPHCVKILDRDINILEINSAGVDLIGADSADAIRGKCGLDLITPEYRGRVQELVHNAFASVCGECDFEILSLKGQHRWLHMTAVPLHNAGKTEVKSVLAISQDITSRRAAVEALRESEARLRLAMEVAGLRMFSMDVATGKISQPPETLALLGLPPGADIADDAQFLAIIHPDDRDHVLQAVERCLTQDIDYAATFRVQPPGESVRWIQAAGRVVTFAEGRRMIGICSDITDRKNAEDALRDSEERFRQMAENVRDVYWMSDVRKSHIGYINSAYEKIWGRSGHDLLRNPRAWIDAIHPDDRERVWRAATTKQTIGQYDEEYRVIRPDGEVRWIRDRAFPIHDPDGNVYRVVGIAEDITERKRVRDEIAAVERRAQAMVENSYDGITVLDEHGINTVWTKSAERIFQRTEAMMMGVPYIKYVHPDDTEHIQQTYIELLQKPGGSVSGCWRFLREDQKWRYIEVTATNLLHDPNILGIVANFRDVTERIDAEQEARRHLAELAHMHRQTTVGQVIWELAHEIAQPLYSITNYSLACQAVLKQEGSAGVDKSLDFMRKISDQSQRASAIIAGLRRFVRNEEPIRTPTHLGEIVSEVVDLVEHDPRVKGLAFRNKTEHNLPLVSVDKTQIEQVLVNLLINAAEAMASVTGPERRIELRSQRVNDTVEVAVRDTGAGVPDDQIDRLFDPYFTTKQEGMGMGLSICRSIIEDHGGRLWAERNPSRGMTFRFTLPISDLTASEDDL